MIKHTPQEWAEFLECWFAMDKDGKWWAHGFKPFLTDMGFEWEQESDFWRQIPNDFVEYSGDWKDSLACPPAPPFKIGEFVIDVDGWFHEWSDGRCPDNYRRPTDKELQRWFPDREIK